METSTAAPAPPGRIVRPRNQGLFGLPPMLRYAADRRMVGMILTFFALETWQWVAPPQSWWVKVPVFLATCAVSFLGAVATHNTLHCPVFHAGWMNSLWQVALTLTYGHPVCSFVPGHNLSHHRHTETRRDIMRTSKARFRWNLLNLLFFASSISSTILGAEIGYLRATWRRRPRWGRQLLLETSVWLGLLAVLFVVDWRKALVYVMIPHAYAAWGIVTMNLLQHDGCDPESKVNHSRNFVGAALNWWTFNNGYHTIHHMRPGLHWSLAPEAHARLVAPFVHPALEQTNLPRYVFGQFVVPGGRKRFDGTPLVLQDPGADEPWFDLPAEGGGAAQTA